MEILVTLFLFSGLIKSFAIYFGIPMPIDFTVLSAAFILVGLINNLFKNQLIIKNHIKIHLLFLLTFFCFAGFSLIYSASPFYKFQKIGQLLLVVFISVAIGLQQNFNFKKIVTSFGIFSIGLAIIYLLIVNSKGMQTENLVYKKFLGLYLSLSINIGLTALLFLFDKSFFKVKVRYSVFTLCLLILLLSAARGPLIILIFSCIVVSLLPFLLGKINAARNKLFIGLSVLGSGTLLFPLLYAKSFLLQRSIWRLSLLVSDVTGSSATSDSVNVRLNNLKFAVERIFMSFKQFLLGNGIGSFGPLFHGLDAKEHPHNIYVEIWFDLGLIGIALFILAIVTPIIIGYKKNLTPLIPGVVLIFLALNYAKSASYSEIRIGMAFMTLFLLGLTSKKLIKDG